METGAMVEHLATGSSGRSRERIAATYLLIVAVDAWLLVVLMDLQMDRSLAEAVAASTRMASLGGLVTLALVALGFIPALVLAMELAARTPPPSPLGRALAGGVAWSSWSAIVALSATSLSGLVLFQTSIFVGLALLAISGAIFAALALDRDTRPPGRALIGLALAIVALTIIGGLLTRGLWGGPA